MADRATKIFGDQIDASIAGAGLAKDIDDNFQVNVDNSTLEISTDDLQVKDLGITNEKIANDTITEEKLNIFNSPVDGYYLKYDSVNGLTWQDVDVDAVQNNDVIVNEVPSGLINSSNTTYTLANTPVDGTVAVYLNGMRQTLGSGEDYIISGNTITFDKAPRTKSKLVVDYIIE